MIFQFGEVLRSQREALGVTQAELCQGICSVPTLSRIENGDRLPTQAILEPMLQRLGCTDLIFAGFVSKEEFQIHELKHRIRRESLRNRIDQARALLQELHARLPRPSHFDRQFLLLHDTQLYEENYSVEEQIARFEEALRLTCPQYRKHSFPVLMSFEEITLMNAIAIGHYEAGRLDYAIEMLTHLKRFYEEHSVNTEEFLRTQPMILYNLSKLLGLSGRYDECIEVCILGIRLAKQSGRCRDFAQTLYNCAWAFQKRGNPGDQGIARTYARQAFYMAKIFGNEKSAERYHNFILKHFGEDISI